jgi:hypothetical protein
MGQDRRIVTKGRTYSGIHGAVLTNAGQFAAPDGRRLLTCRDVMAKIRSKVSPATGPSVVRHTDTPLSSEA